MASSNLVRLTMIEETTYGVTPVSGNFDSVRFTSESLSGTPQTVESATIRTDRMSSGQIVTGLEVGGEVSFELAKDPALEKLLASAMYSDWTTLSLVTVDLSYNDSTKRITRATGSWTPSIVKGDILTLSGFSNAANNTTVQVAEVVSATIIRVIPPVGMVTESGTGTAYKRADKLVIGAAKKSFSVEKAFTDLTTKAINYRGMIAGQLALSVQFGSIITGSVTFSGNDYQTADSAPLMLTNGRTINAPATTNSLNGSVDMPFIASEATGIFQSADLQIQGVDVSLNDNLSAQNVIGKIAPFDYSPGFAQVEVSINAYLTDSAWAILGKKLSQQPFALGFMVKNLGGFYGFYLPEVQVSFDDPSAGGQNETISLDMSGVGKVASDGSSSFVIYRS